MMKKYFPVILLFSLLIKGCGPVVTFTEPQPEGGKNLNAFPAKLFGRYLSLADSSIIIISENKIIREIEFSLEAAKAEFDSVYRIVKDTIVNIEQGDKALIFDKVETEDSLFGRVLLSEAIFSISDTNILRHFKGYYFMNLKKSESSWIVQQVEYSRGKITISKVSVVEDLQKLRELTETTDTTVYVFRPSKKQFKKFVKSDGFGAAEEFIRIKDG